jgi:zinc/manganese transport system substrate-binding protein
MTMLTKIVTLAFALTSFGFAPTVRASGHRDGGRSHHHDPHPPTRLRVVTTLPDYGSLAAVLGGDHVEVQSIVRGDQDAHFIRPKPSFVTMVQQAELLVSTGLDLEMWLPTVVDRSGNRRIRSGQTGYVATSQGMELFEKPATLSRIEGGIHVFGNPHVNTSPLQMKIAARNIALGLAKNDPARRDVYMERLADFETATDQRLFGEELVNLLGGETLCRLWCSGQLIPFLQSRSYRGRPLLDYAGGWLKRMRVLHGTPIVTYHKNWVYFMNLFGIEEAGTVEPKPGIPPSPKHVAELKDLMRERGIRIILAANYFDEHKVRTIAESVGAVAVIVPLYVGGAEGTDDYFALMDLWVSSLVAAAERAGITTGEETVVPGRAR